MEARQVYRISGMNVLTTIKWRPVPIVSAVYPWTAVEGLSGLASVYLDWVGRHCDGYGGLLAGTFHFAGSVRCADLRGRDRSLNPLFPLLAFFAPYRVGLLTCSCLVTYLE